MSSHVAYDGRLVTSPTRYVLVFQHFDGMDMRIMDDLLDEITKFADSVTYIYHKQRHSIYYTLLPGHAPCIITLLVRDALELRSDDVWMRSLDHN